MRSISSFERTIYKLNCDHTLAYRKRFTIADINRETKEITLNYTKNENKIVAIHSV